MTNPQCPFCNTKLSEHEAGRCLDATIHQIKNPNLKITRQNRGIPNVREVYLVTDGDYVSASVPHYSTDMNEAMKLWNGIFHHGTQSHLTRMGTGKNITYKLVMPQMYRTDYFPIATTPALALCRAYIQMKEEGK